MKFKVKVKIFHFATSGGSRMHSGGSRISQTGGRGGAPTITFGPKTYLASFCRKLHENERNWTRGRVPSAASPIPSQILQVNIKIKRWSSKMVSQVCAFCFPSLQLIMDWSKMQDERNNTYRWSLPLHICP